MGEDQSDMNDKIINDRSMSLLRKVDAVDAVVTSIMIKKDFINNLLYSNVNNVNEVMMSRNVIWMDQGKLFFFFDAGIEGDSFNKYFITYQQPRELSGPEIGPCSLVFLIVPWYTSIKALYTPHQRENHFRSFKTFITENIKIKYNSMFNVEYHI